MTVSRVRLAHHEGAHCCVALRLDIPFDLVTIIDDGERAAHVAFAPSWRTGFAEAVVLLAGVVGDSRLTGKPIAELVLDGSKGDLVAACKALERHPRPRPTLNMALDRARELVDSEWLNGHIQCVARALLEAPEGKLSYDEVRAAIAAEQAKSWKSLRWDTPEMRV
jgi:hypothetical protein